MKSLGVFVSMIGQILIACSGAAVAQAIPNVDVKIESAPEVVYDWANNRCDPTDTPDAPARAFRDYLGVVHLLATQQVWREFKGKTLDSVKHVCNVVRISTRDPRPEDYADAEWLSATYSIDGKNIEVILHDEFHGYLRPELCPSRSYSRCWFNAITSATSHDGGVTYEVPTSGEGLVAGLPYKYPPDYGRPIGYFQPTNLINYQGFYYVIFRANQYALQKGGLCMARTSTPNNPKSWRGWNGKDFVVEFIDPYRSNSVDPAAHVCTPLEVNLPWDLGGIVYDTVSHAFILVTRGIVGGGDKRLHRFGIWVATTYDLIHWSSPSLLMADPSGATEYGDPRVSDIDPSILDPSSSDRTYTTIEGRPYLYIIRLNIRNQPYDRQLLRFRLQVTQNSSR